MKNDAGDALLMGLTILHIADTLQEWTQDHARHTCLVFWSATEVGEG